MHRRLPEVLGVRVVRGNRERQQLRQSPAGGGITQRQQGHATGRSCHEETGEPLGGQEAGVGAELLTGVPLTPAAPSDPEFP